MTPEDIMTQSRAVQKEFLNNTKESAVQEKYHQLFKNYPTIFKISFSENFKEDQLQFMLYMKEKMDAGVYSAETAALCVGEELLKNMTIKE